MQKKKKYIKMKQKMRERSRQRNRQGVALRATKVKMTVMTPTHPLVAKIWVHSVERLFTFSSLQTSFERVVDTRLLPKL